MAADIKLLEKDGFGQLELNQVAWRRDGRIEAQCALDATDFATAPAENGMLLAVDKAAGVVTLADTDDIGVLPIGINYSTEHMYDERALGLKYFKLERGEFFPRIGFLAVGDRFTTNLVAYDKGDTEDVGFNGELMTKIDLATTPVYGGISDSKKGHIFVSPKKPTAGPVLRVIEKTTMPDGQPALKFVVVSA